MQGTPAVRDPEAANDPENISPSAYSDTGMSLGDPGASADVGPGVGFPEQDAPQALLNRLRNASASRGTPREPSTRKPAKTARRRWSPDPVYGGRDPEGLGNVFSRMLAERGWRSPVAIGSVLSRWDEIVGADIAAHCVPESFDADTVLVRCDSTAWATQLRLITPQVLQRFEAELGPGVVTRLSVVGPAAPSWRKGGRTVKGRGPRDTYG